MIIENKNGLTKLLAEGNNKITNSERSFFSEFIYLGKNDSPDNYEEVGREIWKHFIEDKPTDFDILSEKISDNNSMIANLEELSLDTDFQLLLLDIRVEDLENTSSPILSKYGLSMVNHILIGDDKMYDLLKKRIIRNTYTSKEDMQEMLDIYYFAGRIKAGQYEELTLLLAEQPKE